MRHNYVIEGFSYRLRPVEDSDASWIVRLRNNPRAVGFIHDTSLEVEKQLAWQAQYYNRPGDFYFIVESKSGSPEGTIGLYNLDDSQQSAEWGRWVLTEYSLAAVESALLIYRFGFEQLHLQEIYCRTLASNSRVIAFHEDCGLFCRSIQENLFSINQETRTALEQVLTLTKFKELKLRLSRLAQSLERDQ